MKRPHPLLEESQLIRYAVGECLDGEPLRVVQWSLVLEEGRCSYRLRSCLDCLNGRLPVGAGGPEPSRSHHECSAFCARGKVGSEEGRIQPG